MPVSSFCASSSTPYSKACQISMRHARTCDATRSHKHERKREKGHLPQWKVHRMRRILRRNESGLLICNNNVAYKKTIAWSTRPRLSVTLGASRRFWLDAWNNKRVRASATFAMLAVCVDSIDYTHLRKHAMNSCTHGQDQKIRVSMCYLPISRRSSRRCRKTYPPPSGKRIMQNTLFTQREVR